MKKAYLCLIINLLSFGSTAQTLLRWNYPCKPGTECWNALTSVEERQNACQIKGLDLKTLSTEELLSITMEHPFFTSYVFHDSPIQGLQSSLEDFNGFQEFFNRKDAMDVLADVYSREDFTKVLQIRDSVQIGQYTLKWTGLELLMTNAALLARMSRERSLNYTKQLYDKLVVKRRLNQFFGGTSFASSALIHYHLSEHLGHKIPVDVLALESFDLFETKLIVANNHIVESLLADLALFIQNH